MPTVTTPLAATPSLSSAVPGVAFAAAALLLPPIAVVAPLGLAPLLTALALALLASDARGCLAAARSHGALFALLALIGAWGATSALWSVIPGHSLLEGLRFFAISASGLIVFAAALRLRPEERRRALYLLIAGIGIAVLLLQLELWTDGFFIARRFHHEKATFFAWIARYDRSVTVLVLMLWPAGALLWIERRLWPLALLLLAVGATIALYHSRTSMLALAAGPVLAALAWRFPRSPAAGSVALVLLLAFALPLAAPGGDGIARIQRALPSLPNSGFHRLVIWRFSGDRVAERPWLGWGMDASRAIPGGQTSANVAFPQVDLSPLAQVMPLHPHDAPLQWRLELGIPGALLGSAAVALIFRRLARETGWPDWRRFAAFGFAASALVIALLSFGIWQSWWLSTLWLGAALLASLGGLRAPEAR